MCAGRSRPLDGHDLTFETLRRLPSQRLVRFMLPGFCDLSCCALPHSRQLSAVCSHGIDDQALRTAKQVLDIVEYILTDFRNYPCVNSIQGCPGGGVYEF